MTSTSFLSQRFDLCQMDLIEKNVRRTCWEQRDRDALSTAAISTVERSCSLLLSTKAIFSRHVFLSAVAERIFEYSVLRMLTFFINKKHREQVFVVLSFCIFLSLSDGGAWQACRQSEALLYLSSHSLSSYEKAEKLIARLRNDSDVVSFD